MLTRSLILLLVVMNAGVAAWWLLRPAGTTPVTAIVDPMAPRLQLAGEASVPPRPVPASTPTVATATPSCFEFGPFADDASLAQVQAVLQPMAVRIEMRREAVRGRGWRVWIPPLADRAAADAMASRIVGAGFKDYYVAPDGAEANSIALGRYGNAEAAQRREASLQAAGFAARAEALGSGARWLQMVATPAFDPTRLPSPIAARQRPLDCTALAPPPGAG